MKTITTILLFIMVLACNGQEPDTIICYDEADIQAQKLLLEDTIEYFENIIRINDSIAIDECVAELENNQAIINNLLLEIQKRDSILYVGKQVDADIFDYLIKGVTDSLQIMVNKVGEEVDITIIDADNVFYINYNGDLIFRHPE